MTTYMHPQIGARMPRRWGPEPALGPVGHVWPQMGSGWLISLGAVR